VNEIDWIGAVVKIVPEMGALILLVYLFHRRERERDDRNARALEQMATAITGEMRSVMSRVEALGAGFQRQVDGLFQEVRDAQRIYQEHMQAIVDRLIAVSDRTIMSQQTLREAFQAQTFQLEQLKQEVRELRSQIPPPRHHSALADATVDPLPEK
jgi:hypothetical protein